MQADVFVHWVVLRSGLGLKNAVLSAMVNWPGCNAKRIGASRVLA